MAPILYFVVPCFNEEAVLPLTVVELVDKIEELVGAGAIAAQSKALLADDGSPDGTWALIQQASAAYPAVEGISLAKNYGQQLALYAGMLEANDRCEVCITLDADGQEDLAAVDSMLDAYSCGNDIVYGVRKSRSVDGVFKRLTATAYYQLLALSGTKTVRGHADYRLVSAEAIKLLETMPKKTVFLRGDLLRLPLQSATVGFERRRRLAGKTKYPLHKMLRLALDGFASNRASSRQNGSTVAYEIADRTSREGA